MLPCDLPRNSLMLKLVPGDTLMPMTRATRSARPAITLLESGRRAVWGHSLAYSGSIFGQVAAVCGAVAVLSHVAPVRETPLSDRPTFLAPLRQEHPHPVQEQITYAALGGVAVVVPETRVGTAERASAVSDKVLLTAVGGGDNQRPTEAHDAESSRAYSEIEVDSAAVRDPDSEGPVYPAELMARGVEGSVLATFVVDVDGRPDVSSFLALESTDTLFALAVRDALPRMKFRAAKRNNVAVRQQVEQRFRFKVVKPDPAPATKRPAQP